MTKRLWPLSGTWLRYGLRPMCLIAIYTFLLAVLLEPWSGWEDHQVLGVFWLLVFSVCVQTAMEFWSERSFLFDMESAYCYASDVGATWRVRVMHFCILWMLCFWCALPVWLLCLPVTTEKLVAWMGLLTLQFPVYVMVLLIARLMTFRLRATVLLVWLLLLPWLMPSALWLGMVLRAWQDTHAVWTYVALQWAWVCFSGLILPRCLDALLRVTYTRLRVSS